MSGNVINGVIVAKGVSVHASPNGRHVVLRLHGDADAVEALVMIEPEIALSIAERMHGAITLCLASDPTMQTTAVN